MLFDPAFLGPALGTLAFFGGIALIVWINQVFNARKRELEHIERLKAVEAGQPLPDAEIAWAEAESSRSTAAGFIGIFVPLVLAGAATGATLIILNMASPWLHLPLLCTIWAVNGLASLVTVVMCLSALMSRGRGKHQRHEARRFCGARDEHHAASF